MAHFLHPRQFFFQLGHGIVNGQTFPEQNLVSLSQCALGFFGTPFRSMPILLMVRVSAGLPSAIMNGGSPDHL